MVDLEELRRVAEAATPGPWYHRQPSETGRDGEPYDWLADDPRPGMHHKIIVARESLYGGPIDYAFLAAANPAVVLHLLDLLATQRKALEEARAQLLVLYTTIARGDAESGARFAANDPAFQKIEAALEASHV